VSFFTEPHQTPIIRKPMESKNAVSRNNIEK
jgi:hypothetical protein